MKRLIKCVLSILLFLVTCTISVNATDFSENEEYYDNLCSGSLSDSATIETCKLYQVYLNDKAGDRLNDLSDIQAQLADIKENIAENIKKVSDYEKQITEIEDEITALENSIQVTEQSIIELEAEIAAREQKIADIDETIQNRMVSMQSYIHVNNYLEFLIGATSFIDLIRRVEALSDIESSDHELMDELEIEINTLNTNKEELSRQKESLESNKANVEANKQYIEGLKAYIEKALIEYYNAEADLEAQANQIAEDYQNSVNKLKDISAALGNILPSPGWTQPVVNASVTASTWHYPASFGGGVHLGVDLANPVGTTIKAVANGVVLYSANACSTYGYLGNTCGYPGSSGGGNQVYLLVSVGTKSYAIKYLHLKKDTAISTGTIVNAGDKIGEIGSSGNASGAHVHIEIFYLGTKSLSYYANNWDGDLSFGAGWGSAALNKTCDNTGGSSPCRLQPKSILGY